MYCWRSCSSFLWENIQEWKLTGMLKEFLLLTTCFCVTTNNSFCCKLTILRGQIQTFPLKQRLTGCSWPTWPFNCCQTSHWNGSWVVGKVTWCITVIQSGLAPSAGCALKSPRICFFFISGFFLFLRTTWKTVCLPFCGGKNRLKTILYTFQRVFFPLTWSVFNRFLVELFN